MLINILHFSSTFSIAGAVLVSLGVVIVVVPRWLDCCGSSSTKKEGNTDEPSVGHRASDCKGLGQDPKSNFEDCKNLRNTPVNVVQKQ